MRKAVRNAHLADSSGALAHVVLRPIVGESRVGAARRVEAAAQGRSRHMRTPHALRLSPRVDGASITVDRARAASALRDPDHDLAFLLS